MLGLIVTMSLIGVAVDKPTGEYLVVTAKNEAGTIRSTLTLPSVVDRPVGSDRFRDIYDVFVSLENISDKSIEVWDAVWGGTTLFYALSERQLPRSNVMRLVPPLPAELRIKLKPNMAICESMGLDHFWDFSKMKDGTFDVALYYTDEGFWPKGEESLEIGTIFYHFTVRVKGGQVYFEPRRGVLSALSKTHPAKDPYSFSKKIPRRS